MAYQISPNDTDNLNYLGENKYQFILDRSPKTVFMVSSVETPSYTVTTESLNTMMGVPFNVSSSKGSYGTLTVTFFVDEDLVNYKELKAWMKSNINETNFSFKQVQRAALDLSGKPLLNTNRDELYNYTSDGSLVTLTNAGNPNKIISFYSMIPISLSGINFTNKSTGDITASITFIVETYDIS